MGGGTWVNASYINHSTVTRGFATTDAFLKADVQDLYRANCLNEALNPYKVMRECRDSSEHPNTIPVILALDVTGSMGDAASAVAKQLGDIMSELYKSITDVEFSVMAIGDLSYDTSPIQISQFESDIRIAENLEKIYFERGGGGNRWESYTAAWYMGLYHTNLDCWARNKKGIIITMGDEGMNPYLPKTRLTHVTGDKIQGDIETSELYKSVIEKFDVYHIAIDDKRTSYSRYATLINDSWGKLLGENLKITNCDNLANVISDLIINSSGVSDHKDNDTTDNSEASEGTLISW